MQILIGFFLGMAVLSAVMFVRELMFHYEHPAATTVPTVVPSFVYTLMDHGRPTRRSWLQTLLDAVDVDVFGKTMDITAWWSDQTEALEYERSRRNVPARHRRDEMDVPDSEWRTRWAEHATQGWPTLATAGNAWDTMDPRPVICLGGLLADNLGGPGLRREVDPRPAAPHPPKRQGPARDRRGDSSRSPVRTPPRRVRPAAPLLRT